MAETQKKRQQVFDVLTLTRENAWRIGRPGGVENAGRAASTAPGRRAQRSAQRASSGAWDSRPCHTLILSSCGLFRLARASTPPHLGLVPTHLPTPEPRASRPPGLPARPETCTGSPVPGRWSAKADAGYLHWLGVPDPAGLEPVQLPRTRR